MIVLPAPRIFVIVLACVIVAGCGGPAQQESAAPAEAPPAQAPAPAASSTPPPAPSPVAAPVEAQAPTPEDLLASWKALAAEPELNRENIEAVSLAIQMARSGPDGLDPLFEILADPASKPLVKVMVVDSVQSVVTAEMAPKLIPMVAVDQDSTTRACATQLLVYIAEPELEDTFNGLLEDEDPRIRLAALSGLVTLGSQDARKQVAAILEDKDASQGVVDKALLILAEEPVEEELDIMRQALTDARLSTISQRKAVEAIGRLGEASDAELLDQFGETVADVELKHWCSAMSKQIRKRHKETPAAG